MDSTLVLKQHSFFRVVAQKRPTLQLALDAVYLSVLVLDQANPEAPAIAVAPEGLFCQEALPFCIENLFMPATMGKCFKTGIMPELIHKPTKVTHPCYWFVSHPYNLIFPNFFHQSFMREGFGLGTRPKRPVPGGRYA